ncbi:MAG: oligosaccharide flippase family protein [Candidatus Eisenbacteria bacterium]
MSIRRDAMSTFTVQMFTLLAGLVTSVVVARTIGPEGKGLISFLGYALFVATNIAGLGLQPAAIQHLGKGRFPAATVAATQLFLGLLAGAVCAAGLLFMLPLFKEQMQLTHWMLLLFLPVVILALQRLNLSGVLIGIGRIEANNRLQALTPAAWMVGAVVTLWALAGGPREAAIAWMIAQTVAPLLTLVWIVRLVRPRWQSIAECARASLRFGAEAYLANLVWTILLRAGGLMLAYLNGAAAVGIYSIAILMGETLWYLPRSLTVALNPRVAAGCQTDVMRLSLRAVRIALWMVVAASLALLLIGQPLIRLVFGEAFSASFRPLMLLLPGIVAGAIASPIALYFTQYKGRPRVNAGVAALGLLVNLVLNVLWIPAYGASGAAGASTCAYLLVGGLMALQLKREPGFAWRAMFCLRREDVTALREALRELLQRPAPHAPEANSRRRTRP